MEKWLNEEFYKQAFSDEEKKLINKTKLRNKDYKGTELSVSKDYIFCLSFDDVTKTKYGFSDWIMDSDIKRRCVPTAYAIAQGVTASEYSQNEEGYDTCEWWLRYSGSGTTGEILPIISYYGEGHVWGDTTGDPDDVVRYDDIAVRPALYINLD